MLELLVQRAPEIVSREEIRRHVWGDAVYIDATQSINFCIRQIRLALGDTSAGSRFIETLPRQGYRFDSRHSDEIPGNTGIPESVPVQESRPGDPHPTLADSRVGCSCCTGMAIVSLLSGSASGKLASRRGAEYGLSLLFLVTSANLSLSPDGRQVAFSWGGKTGDNRDIYVTLLGEQDPLRLTFDSAEDAYPAWSPDGKHIAFIRRRAGTRADIMLVSSIGGPERKLREIRLGGWLSQPDAGLEPRWEVALLHQRGWRLGPSCPLPGIA